MGQRRGVGDAMYTRPLSLTPSNKKLEKAAQTQKWLSHSASIPFRTDFLIL